MAIDFRKDYLMVILLAIGLVVALFIPQWMLYIVQTSIAGGLVALGVMLQMRAGLVSFGQGLYFCLGGYTAGMLGANYGVHDIGIVLPAAILICLGVSLLLGALLSRYREIFFAMLSLAFSMILYGLLVKATGLGSTDGFNLPAVTYLGFLPDQASRSTYSYLFAVTILVLVLVIVLFYLKSSLGALCEAVRENELRVEYLGGSVKGTVYVLYVIGAIISGIGGVLYAITSGHVHPEMTNWTTSGTFVFVALLAGRGSVIAPILGMLLIEFIKSFALDYFPNAWQLILGVVMMTVILTLPEGLWSLIRKNQTRGGGTDELAKDS